ncbi:hypothetical protein A2333_00865 [Candidatus Wolfebacteria bacterium RIFOXYB2_FULL_49_7]|uniref:Uncharacterized protein n=1 Tax=Candidatus Wolfebacteria bacterium RIFOXYB1_FULL_54_12 TaxID=1802559 RepID=A0A1F8DVP8_9BACT|nr:MAG: hypothetical protein A2372_00635 [Candidatus Wolfebacteria bacterium RIFOXYB1_FULL_54_12]OGM94152.1 MAG: hypothetical protein A2333_00865 [Candidatus Wolfebacteria bacterium RIFOXYB2_FULL_49_7]
MSKRILTQEEQETLRHNHNVASCSAKSISFAPAFKQRAIREYKEGVSPQEIFSAMGLPLSLIGRKTPSNCLKEWLAIERKQGIDALLSDGRGRHGKTGRKRIERVDKSKMTKDERIAYLEAENDFLAQLRGIPRTSFKYRPGNDTQ